MIDGIGQGVVGCGFTGYSTGLDLTCLKFEVAPWAHTDSKKYFRTRLASAQVFSARTSRPEPGNHDSKGFLSTGTVDPNPGNHDGRGSL